MGLVIFGADRFSATWALLKFSFPCAFFNPMVFQARDFNDLNYFYDKGSTRKKFFGYEKNLEYICTFLHSAHLHNIGQYFK